MINENQKSRITRFLNDEATSDAVKQAILNSFLKSKPNRDVYQLAASRLAIDMLDEAWRDLERFKDSVNEKISVGKQVGL
jgi:F0F1-type ATP synthase delta subunit